MLRAALVLLHSAPTFLLRAQTTSSLSGMVTDAATQQAIQEVTVEVVVNDSTITDAVGRFRFPAIRTGIHMVRARRMGYEGAMIPEVRVRAGKPEQIEIALRAAVHELGTVEIEADALRSTSNSSAQSAGSARWIMLGNW